MPFADCSPDTETTPPPSVCGHHQPPTLDIPEAAASWASSPRISYSMFSFKLLSTMLSDAVPLAPCDCNSPVPIDTQQPSFFLFSRKGRLWTHVLSKHGTSGGLHRRLTERHLADSASECRVFSSLTYFHSVGSVLSLLHWRLLGKLPYQADIVKHSFMFVSDRIA